MAFVLFFLFGVQIEWLGKPQKWLGKSTKLQNLPQNVHIVLTFCTPLIKTPLFMNGGQS